MNRDTTAIAASPRPSWAMLALISLMAASAGASAQEGSASAPEAAPTTARMWLDAQAKGSMASRNRQTLHGPVMSRVYQRYLKQLGGKGPEEPDTPNASGDHGAESNGNAASELMKSLSGTKP